MPRVDYGILAGTLREVLCGLANRRLHRWVQDTGDGCNPLATAHPIGHLHQRQLRWSPERH